MNPGMDGTLVRLDPARVKPFAKQPRKRFRGIRQLAESIRTIGQVTPIVVTPCDDPGYEAELVDGERRLRACLTAGLKVTAVVEPGAAGNGDLRFAPSVAGNFCRQGHDAVEILEAILAMLDAGRTPAQIASICGKPEGWVRQYMRLRGAAPQLLELLKAPPEGTAKKDLRRGGRMTLSLALCLVVLPHGSQVKAARRILAHRMGLAEARTYIARLGVAQGRTLGVAVGPRKRFHAVAAAVARCDHVVERYLRMPGLELRALVRNADRGERKALSASLESLCESLLLLSDALDKRAREASRGSV